MSSKDGPAVKIHPGPDALSRLYHVVAHNALMLQDLFKSWDTNNDGRVSKIEFAKGLSSLNWDAPKETVEALFNHMDKDKVGISTTRNCKRPSRPTNQVRPTKSARPT